MALLLRDVVGLSYAEIAESLEITLATVKWRIYKAARRSSSPWPARNRRCSATPRPRRRADPERSDVRRRAVARLSGRPASTISACVSSIG